MRVLALHGRYQSAKVFARKLAVAQELPSSNGVWTQLGDQADLVSLEFPNDCVSSPVQIVCIDAPNIVEPKIRMKRTKIKLKHIEDNLNNQSLVARAWWEIENGDKHPVGYENSIRHIQKVLYEHGPFDGLFGFSQGACLAALLCTNALAEQMKWKPTFALLCSAYSSPLECHQDLIGSGFVENLNSIHLYSKNDFMVLPKKSEELCESMKGICVIHEKGHSLPGKKEFSTLDWLHKY